MQHIFRPPLIPQQDQIEMHCPVLASQLKNQSLVADDRHDAAQVI